MGLAEARLSKQLPIQVADAFSQPHRPSLLLRAGPKGPVNLSFPFFFVFDYEEERVVKQPYLSLSSHARQSLGRGRTEGSDEVLKSSALRKVLSQTPLL